MRLHGARPAETAGNSAKESGDRRPLANDRRAHAHPLRLDRFSCRASCSRSCRRGHWCSCKTRTGPCFCSLGRSRRQCRLPRWWRSQRWRPLHRRPDRPRCCPYHPAADHHDRRCSNRHLSPSARQSRRRRPSKPALGVAPAWAPIGCSPLDFGRFQMPRIGAVSWHSIAGPGCSGPADSKRRHCRRRLADRNQRDTRRSVAQSRKPPLDVSRVRPSAGAETHANLQDTTRSRLNRSSRAPRYCP